MSFSFGAATTTASSAFGTSTPSTGFSFGGGDTKPFGAAATDNKAAFNFSSTTSNAPTFGGGGFSFGGAKPATSTPSLFSTPAATTAASAFGASKPLSLTGFTSPPNQTVGPGFGQPVQQGTPQNLSFGAAAAQPNTAAPTFGSPVQSNQAQPPVFGANTSLSFNKPTTAFGGFQTPASGFSSVQQPATATTTTVQTTQSASSFGATTTTSSFGFGAKPAFSFGPATGQTNAAQPPAFGATTSTPSTGLSFASPQTQAPSTVAPTPSTGLNFGQTPAYAQTTAPALGQTTLSFGQTTPGLNFGTAQAGQTGLSFKTSQSPGLNFGTSQPSQIGFGGATAVSSSGQPLATAQPSLSFGTTQPTLNIPQPTSTQPATSLSFPAPLSSNSAPVSAPAASNSAPVASAVASTGLSFGTSTATTGIGLGLNFGKPTVAGTTATTALSASKPATGFSLPTSQPSSTAATTAPSGIAALNKTTATTAPTSLVPTTSTAVSLPSVPAGPPAQITSLTFTQLQENINKWTIELEEQEKTFINQATQINAWDTLLIANGEKIVELNDAVQTVKNDQQTLEHELDFILAQQKELEELLAPLEKQLLDDTGDRMRDTEREMMYNLAENLDTQLRQMSEDLKEVIEHLNDTNRSQDSNDPIVQIGRILNAHMSSMQWIDSSIAQISTKLDQLKATHDTLRRDNERSFQLTYN